MLLWADSFDHYGGLTSNMLLGAYSQISAGPLGEALITISTSFARTGTRSLKFQHGTSGLTNTIVARRSLGGSPKITCGQGFGMYNTSLPVANNYIGWQFRDISNVPRLTVLVQSDGSICVRKGTESGTIIAISDTVLFAGSFNHIETWVTFDDVAGYVEVRVNGVTVIMEVGIDTDAVGATQVTMCAFNSRDFQDFYVDDWNTGDSSGTLNNTFIGPQRCLTEFPSADTAQADWALTGAGTGHGCIDQATPDGDTTYISSSVVGSKSDFALPSLPPETSAIKGVYVPLMARIDAAGIGNVKPSMKSAAALAAGVDSALTTGYAYYGSVFETDPNTGLPWTKAGLEAALLRIEKSL